MKKFLLLISIMFITGCSSVENNKELNSNNEFVYSTYSTAVLLSNITESSVSTVGFTNINSSSNVVSLSTTEETEVESSIEKFNEYYGMLKPFIDEGSKDIFSIAKANSTNNEYEVEMEVKIQLSDRVESMTLYYNEDENGNFEGQVLLGSDTYQLIGINENEEDVTKLEATAYLDEFNYVSMELQTEENEVKYKYEVSRDGVIEVSEVEIENEDDEFKVELELEVQEYEASYTLKKEYEDGVKVTKIEYEVNDIEGVIYVDITTNEYGEEIVSYRVIETGKEEKVIEEHSKELSKNTDEGESV